jgi:hypothetical protein
MFSNMESEMHENRTNLGDERDVEKDRAVRYAAFRDKRWRDLKIDQSGLPHRIDPSRMAALEEARKKIADDNHASYDDAMKMDRDLVAVESDLKHAENAVISARGTLNLDETGGNIDGTILRVKDLRAKRASLIDRIKANNSKHRPRAEGFTAAEALLKRCAEFLEDRV